MRLNPGLFTGGIIFFSTTLGLLTVHFSDGLVFTSGGLLFDAELISDGRVITEFVLDFSISEISLQHVLFGDLYSTAASALAYVLCSGLRDFVEYIDSRFRLESSETISESNP